MTERPSLRVVDDPGVRESVATAAVSATLLDGTLLVTLAAQRALPETVGGPPAEAPVAQVTARLALTPSAAVDLVNMLGSLLATIPGVSVGPAGRPTTPPNTPH